MQKTEGFELRTFAVPPPGVEMGAQVLDITAALPARFRHRASVRPLAVGRDQGAKRDGYPLRKVIGLVWASAEADIKAAGGLGVAEGYHTMQFAGVGDDYPVRQEIKEMYKAQGKAAAEGDGEHASSTIAGC